MKAAPRSRTHGAPPDASPGQVKRGDSRESTAGGVAPLLRWLLPAVLVGMPALYVVLSTARGDWDDWQQATCMPDFCFCEAVRHGTLLRQPTNTWTNVPFAALGAAVIGRYSFLPRRALPLEVWQAPGFAAFALLFGASCVLLGASSFFYHASLTFYGQWLDNMGMVSVLLSIAANALFRQRVLRSTAGMVNAFVAANVGLGVALVAVAPLRRHVFLGTVVATTALEVWDSGKRRAARALQDTPLDASTAATHDAAATATKGSLRRRARSPAPQNVPVQRRRVAAYGLSYLLAALAVFVLAFVVWVLDLRRILCAPESVWQGHGLWHVLCAVVIMLAFLHEVRCTLQVYTM